MLDPVDLGARLAAVEIGGVLTRFLPWRSRSVVAHERGLAITRASAEVIAWAAVDAVIGGARPAIHAGGRVVARLPDTDASERLIAIVVERAGLVWLPAGRRRGPTMAVQPAVAAKLAPR